MSTELLCKGSGLAEARVVLSLMEISPLQQTGVEGWTGGWVLYPTPQAFV